MNWVRVRMSAIRSHNIRHRPRRTRSRRLSSASSAVSALIVVVASTLHAQPAQPPGGRGRGAITSPRNAYPDRAPADPAAIERGKALYGANCTFCHGADTRGGDGGPSLLRAAIVLADQSGELIAPVVKDGRTDRGMPKFSLSDTQIADIAAFIHSFNAA